MVYGVLSIEVSLKATCHKPPVIVVMLFLAHRIWSPKIHSRGKHCN